MHHSLGLCSTNHHRMFNKFEIFNFQYIAILFERLFYQYHLLFSVSLDSIWFHHGNMHFLIVAIKPSILNFFYSSWKDFFSEIFLISEMRTSKYMRFYIVFINILRFENQYQLIIITISVFDINP